MLIDNTDFLKLKLNLLTLQLKRLVLEIKHDQNLHDSIPADETSEATHHDSSDIEDDSMFQLWLCTYAERLPVAEATDEDEDAPGRSTGTPPVFGSQDGEASPSSTGEPRYASNHQIVCGLADCVLSDRSLYWLAKTAPASL